ncbi:MAG: sigma-70 family RNA polymerase sigma factor [Chitinophagaceae bacterium]|nr:sigma-70 family RNA polymerase sigma factor [Chitinophagaceae bacterium]
MNHEDQNLEKLYRDAFPHIARLLHSLGADLDAARDLFHDAMVIYLEKKRDNCLPVHVSPRQYLAGIARILWFKQCKHERRQTDIRFVEDSLPAEEAVDPEKKSLLLYKYLKVAGNACLQLLQAFYYEKLSMPAIAGKFHYGSAHSATVQKYKCLEKLREKIKQTEIYEEVIA